MKWQVTTVPTDELFTWPRLKAALRLNTDGERSYVMDDLLPHAVGHAEKMMQASLAERTITATFYEGEKLHLPRGPVIEIESIIDDDGNEVEADEYRVGHSDRLTITSASVTYPIVVIYRAGHEDLSLIDADIYGCIRVHIATLYKYREDTTSEAVNAIHKIDEYYRFNSRGSPVA